MIEFNVPLVLNKSFDYIIDAVNNKHICGDGMFTKNVRLGLRSRQMQQNVCLQLPVHMR